MLDNDDAEEAVGEDGAELTAFGASLQAGLAPSERCEPPNGRTHDEPRQPPLLI